MKKLIALLIAVLMVVALVPATVLSAMVSDFASADSGTEGGDSPSTANPDSGLQDDIVVGAKPEEVTDERVETPAVAEQFDKEFTEGTDKFEVVNKNGTLVGYFADLAAADAWVREGDTLRFLADITITENYTFGAGRAALAKVPTAYTIDGNGHKVVYTAASGERALTFGGNCASHSITVTDLCVISAKGGVTANPGSGNGMRVTLEDCQIYANDAYYFVNPDFYTDNNLTYDGTTGIDGVAGFTVNTYLTLKGEDTKVYANGGMAVYGTCVVTIYDGEYYSTGNDATLYVRGDKTYTNRTEHKLIIYGGTFVNDKMCAARVACGATAVIFGGNFIMTTEKTTDYWGAAYRSGTGSKDGEELNVAQTYILGGNFYTDAAGTHGATAVPTQGAIAAVGRGGLYIANANFFYTGNTPYGGQADAIKISASATQTTVDVTENNTLTVPSFLTGTGTDTVTWTKKTTLAFDATKYDGAFSAEGAILDAAVLAAAGFEAAILDAEGNVLDLVHVDDNTDNSIHKGTKAAWLTATAAKLQYTTLMTPDGGTFFVLADITGAEGGGDSYIFNRVPDGTYTLNGNGKTICISNNGRYLSYSAGGANLIIKNVTFRNPTGRALEFGQNEFIPVSWTLTDTVVEAGSGSAFVTRKNATLNLGKGSVLRCLLTSDSWVYAVQMHVDSTVNLVGGTVEGYYDAAKGYKRSPFCGVSNEGTRYVNLISGKLVLPWGTAQAICDFDGSKRTVALTLSPDVELVDATGAPVANPATLAGQVQLTNPGADPVVYTTLAEALKNAQAGATVSLQSDIWATEKLLIDKDLTLLGNGYTLYDISYIQYTPVITIAGDGTDVVVRNLTVSTMNTGIYVSSNDFLSTILNNTHNYSEASSFAANATTDAHKISVLLDNCKVLAGMPDASVFDGIDDADYMKSLVTSVTASSCKGALLMHGANVHVTVTGAAGMYASVSPDFAIYNHGGYLDIYDGFFYAHNAYQVVELFGRLQTATAASANDQIQCGTTAIYGGRFVAGPKISTSGAVIRVLRGHNLIVMGGEFLLTTQGANVIRFSDSNKAGYAYILGGTFYNGLSSAVFGGNANVGYLRIFGGKFYSNGNPGIANTRFTTGSFNINHGATLQDGKLQGGTNIDGTTNLSYGMIIDEAYTVNTYDHSDAPVYPANTALNWVKQVGFTKLQEVDYDADWMETNGYYAQGFTYMVTDGVNTVPAKYYSFELERALLHLGNCGTFTLTRDVTVNYLGKPTADGGFDTDYNFFARFRPLDAKITFNSTAKEGKYYTITATATSRPLLALYGGYYQFDNIGLINTNGGTIRLYSTDSVLRITDGYYEAKGTTNTMHETLFFGESNNVAYIEGGVFTANRAILTLKSNEHLVLGVEGTKHGPTIIMNGEAAIKSIGDGATITCYYVTFDDIGTAGQNIWAAGYNLTLNIYDGYFYVNNGGSHYPIMQITSDDTDVNIYGGTFVRTNTGLGGTNYGKGIIFEHTGTANIYGGTFVTHVVNNTFFTVRKNKNLALVFGDKETGKGPTITSAGGHNILFDDGNTTNFTLDIYGGTYSTGGNSNLWIGSASSIKGTINVYNGTFTQTGAAHVLSVGGKTTNIYNGTFTNSGTDKGCILHAGGAATITVYDGKFVTTNTARFIIPTNNAVYNLYGGEYILRDQAIQYAATEACKYTITFGKLGAEVGPYFSVSVGCMILAQGGSEPHITFNAITTENYCGGSNTLAYYCSKGSLTINNGDFLQVGTSRMFRIGSAFSGDIRILNGTFYGECSDILVLADDCSSNVIIGNADGTGPQMYNKKEACVQIDTNKKVNVQIRGGQFSTDGEHVLNFTKAAAGTAVTIDNGTFEGSKINKVYALQQGSANIVTTINGGNFTCTGNPDACISVGGGTVTIHGGYFYNNGLCVARALGGQSSTQAADLNNCFITTQTNATLIIKGGLFVLGQHEDRPINEDTINGDAVIRVGGWNTYGFVRIEGGTFINTSKINARVITKNNPASTIELVGGIFLAGSNQTYYFKSQGQGLQNGVPVGGIDPADIPVDRNNDLTVDYGNATYHFYVLGDYSTEAVQVTESAEIRVIKLEELNHYVGGLRFTSTISKAAIDLFMSDFATATVTVEYGTLIVPKDILANITAFTHAELQAAGLTYMDIAADRSLVLDADGNATFTAAITDIKAENYARAFVAVGYAKLNISMGEVNTQSYVYTDYDESGASLAALAQALLDNEPNAPAPYSAGLKAALTAYAAALPQDGGGNVPVPPVKDDVVEDPFASDNGQNQGE